MGEFLNFVNQYGNTFVSEIQYDDYEKLKANLLSKVEEILSFRGVIFNEKDKLVLYAMRYFLSKYTPKEILNGNFEDELEEMAKRAYDALESRKPKDEQKPFPERNLAVDYLYKDFKDKSFIFREDFNIGKYAKNVRDNLVYEGYKDEDIIEGVADQRVIELMAGGYLEIRLSEEFRDMKASVSDLVIPYFNFMKKESLNYDSRNSFEYMYYDNRNILMNVIFCLSIEFTRQGVNSRKLTSNTPEVDVIHRYIQRDKIRINSTRPKQETEPENFKKTIRVVKEDRAEHSKKSAIVIAILFGLTALENLIYKSIHEKETELKHNRKQINIETTSYDIDRISNNIQRLRYKDDSVVNEVATVRVEDAPIDTSISENFIELEEGDHSD